MSEKKSYFVPMMVGAGMFFTGFIGGVHIERYFAKINSIQSVDLKQNDAAHYLVVESNRSKDIYISMPDGTYKPFDEVFDLKESTIKAEIKAQIERKKSK